MQKGQSSVEFLIILSISLVVILSMMYYSQNSLVELNNIKLIDTAQTSVNELVDSANSVYLQGEGARKKVYYEIPSNTTDAETGVFESAVVINVLGSDVYKSSNARLSGSIDTSLGGHWVWITAKQGYVYFGTENITLNKSSIYVTMLQDTNANTSFTISNASQEIANIIITENWTNTDVTLSSAPLIFSIPAEDSQIIDINFTSNLVATGNYTGTLSISAIYGAEIENIEIPLNAEVTVSGGTSGTGEMYIFPSTFSASLQDGDSIADSFDICNDSASTITDINFTISGTIATWVEPINNIATLASGDCQPIAFTVNVPGGTSPSLYTGTITGADENTTGTNSDSISLSITVTATPDTNPPIVSLSSPASGYTDTDGDMTFEYTVTDAESGIASCSLIIDGSIDQTDNTITEGITQTFIKNGMANGSYTWDVNCTDNSSNFNEGTSGEARAFTINIAGGSQTIYRWATVSLSGVNNTGAPDNLYGSTKNGYLAGSTFDVSGLSGTITQVRIIWSHQIPGAISNDTITLNYGLTVYNDLTIKTYDSGNTPVDFMGLTSGEWEFYDATSNRPGGGSWQWSDFANLKTGGRYTKSGKSDTSWYLDAVGVEITYTS